MLGRLDVRCIGSSNGFGHATNGDATSSVAFSHDNTPFFLVGCGGGVVRSCFRQLGALPSSVFLPSVRLSSILDLQAYIQHEAAYQRKTKVFAAADVLDRAISLLDEEIVNDVKEFVEFLQVEPNVPTSVHTHYFFVMMPINKFAIQAPRGFGNGGSVAVSTAYNLILLNVHQVPLVAYFEGPANKENLYDEANVFLRQCPTAVANVWKYFEQRVCQDSLGPSTRLHVMGFSNDRPPQLESPAVALRCGDMFVVPTSGEGGAGELIQKDPTPERRPQTGEDVFSPNDPGWLRSASDAPQTASQRPPHAYNVAPRPTVSFDNREPQAFSDPYSTRQRPSERPPPTRMRPASPGASQRPRSPATSRRATTPGRAGFPPESRSPSGNFTAYGGKPRQYAARGQMFSQETSAPKKLLVFNNESKQDEPTIVMVPSAMQLLALKKKVGVALKLKPMGQLYTVDGGLVRSVDELGHGQEVVATQHAGAPFDLNRLPHKMRFIAPAAPIEEVPYEEEFYGSDNYY